jgi:hypothetical protein
VSFVVVNLKCQFSLNGRQSPIFIRLGGDIKSLLMRMKGIQVLFIHIPSNTKEIFTTLNMCLKAWVFTV